MNCFSVLKSRKYFLYRVAGWDMKTCPRLNDKIHIGDQLLKINDKRVKNSADAQKMYKSAEDSVILTVQRLPYAQVIAIHRQETKQPIGIQRDGGTSKVPNQNMYWFCCTPIKKGLALWAPKSDPSLSVAIDPSDEKCPGHIFSTLGPVWL